MKIAVAGLGKMGMQIAQKLAEDGHQVIAHNRSADKVDQAAKFGAQPAYEKQAVVEAFAAASDDQTSNQKVVLWLMVPADKVDEQLNEWLKILPPGSVIIDGGNSDYRLTKVRSQKVVQAGMNLIDSGTSGGVWGYQNGFSIMIGGEREVFAEVESIFKTLAEPGGGYQYFGPSGAGHFVKMVHNAIEYGMMQSLAEGYRLLKEGPYQGLDLAQAGAVWQQGSVVSSWLNDLAAQALKENPELAGVDGYVAESGEAMWAIETAKELNVPLPAIEAAFDIRLRSQSGEVNFATKLLAAMRAKFGGHSLNKD